MFSSVGFKLKIKYTHFFNEGIRQSIEIQIRLPTTNTNKFCEWLVVKMKDDEI